MNPRLLQALLARSEAAFTRRRAALVPPKRGSGNEPGVAVASRGVPYLGDRRAVVLLREPSRNTEREVEPRDDGRRTMLHPGHRLLTRAGGFAVNKSPVPNGCDPDAALPVR